MALLKVLVKWTLTVVAGIAVLVLVLLVLAMADGILQQRSSAAHFEVQAPFAATDTTDLGLMPTELVESSGLAISRAHPGVIWSHNDSGDGPVVYQMDTTAVVTATYTVTPATAYDWESMDLGVCPEIAGGETPSDSSPEWCLYLADVGDNDRRRDTEQGVYQLDRVIPVEGVRGRARMATQGDVETLIPWGEGFGQDLGEAFTLRAESIRKLVDRNGMFVWVDGGLCSMTVAQGLTGTGCRVGYVYTPPERRGSGYASALVAAVSQRMFDAGLSFCVLYTDLSNPTSNSIYKKIGYARIADVVDVEIEGSAVE